MKFTSIFKRVCGWRRHVARAFIVDDTLDARSRGGDPSMRFLIAKGRIPPRIWHLPGGGIGKSETPEIALRRELSEELCLSREHVESITWIGQRTSRVLFVPHLEELFIVRVKSGLSDVPLNAKDPKSPIRKTWELADAKWVSRDEFERLVGHDSLYFILDSL